MINSPTDSLQSEKMLLMTATLTALVGYAIAMDCIPAVGFACLHPDAS